MTTFKDFKIVKIIGNSPLNWEYFAEVTEVTTKGFWIWKKVSENRRLIYREYLTSWHFVDSGTIHQNHFGNFTEMVSFYSHKAARTIKVQPITKTVLLNIINISSANSFIDSR